MASRARRRASASIELVEGVSLMALGDSVNLDNNQTYIGAGALESSAMDLPSFAEKSRELPGFPFPWAALVRLVSPPLDAA